MTIDDNIVAGPVAEPDTYAVVTNLPLSVGADQGVLANDHDPQAARCTRCCAACRCSEP